MVECPPSFSPSVSGHSLMEGLFMQFFTLLLDSRDITVLFGSCPLGGPVLWNVMLLEVFWQILLLFSGTPDK